MLNSASVFMINISFERCSLKCSLSLSLSLSSPLSLSLSLSPRDLVPLLSLRQSRSSLTRCRISTSTPRRAAMLIQSSSPEMIRTLTKQPLQRLMNMPAPHEQQQQQQKHYPCHCCIAVTASTLTESALSYPVIFYHAPLTVLLLLRFCWPGPSLPLCFHLPFFFLFSFLFFLFLFFFFTVFRLLLARPLISYLELSLFISELVGSQMPTIFLCHIITPFEVFYPDDAMSFNNTLCCVHTCVPESRNWFFRRSDLPHNVISNKS